MSIDLISVRARSVLSHADTGRGQGKLADRLSMLSDTKINVRVLLHMIV